MLSKVAKYMDMTHHKGSSLTQQGREEGIRRLMSINLLKRLESSVASFRLTIDRIKKLIDDTIGTIKNHQSGDCALNLTEISSAEDFDYDDQNTDFFSVGKKVKIDLADMDYVSWMRELEKEKEIVVCPPIWYGVASYAVGGPETGTIQVDEDAYTNYLYCILKSMIYGGVKNIYLNFFVRKFDKRLFNRFDRTLNVGFNDNIKRFQITVGNLGEQIVERDA